MLNGVRSILENEYEHLKARIHVRAVRYGFSRCDVEDILHDAIVIILENSLRPDEYYEAISKALSRARYRRHG